MITELICLTAGAVGTWFFIGTSHAQEHQKRQELHEAINEKQQENHQSTVNSLKKATHQADHVVAVSRKILYGTIDVVKNTTSMMEDALGNIRKTTDALQETSHTFVTSTERIEEQLQQNSEHLLQNMQRISEQLGSAQHSLQTLPEFKMKSSETQNLMKENEELKRLLSESIQLNQSFLAIIANQRLAENPDTENEDPNLRGAFHVQRN